jgi:hypothetical protein
MPCIQQGPGLKGSQKWIQKLVNEKPDLLNEDSLNCTVSREGVKPQQLTCAFSSRLVEYVPGSWGVGISGPRWRHRWHWR